MAPFIKISGRRIEPGYPIYIVTEMSANYDGQIGILPCSFAADAGMRREQDWAPLVLTVQR